jgi:hypothetical protein
MRGMYGAGAPWGIRLRVGCYRAIAHKIGCVPQTLHEWVRKQKTDTGIGEGVTTAVHLRVNELKRENQELRRPARSCLTHWTRLIGSSKRIGPTNCGCRISPMSQTGRVLR